MANLRKPLFFAAGLTLAACSGFQLDRARNLSPQGTPFDTALFSDYLDLSQTEFDEADFTDSDFFALRAIKSGTGGGVGPQGIDERRLPDKSIPELASARRKLVMVLGDTASEKAPEAAARAQVMFDCWLQEQEENIQPDDIAACRNRFFAALDKAEAAVKAAAPPPPPAVPVEPVQQDVAPPPEPPQPPPATVVVPPPARPGPVRVVILFDFDSAEVPNSAQEKIGNITTAVKERKRARVTVSGHTDRAGADGYNNRLAERRVEAVANALSQDGIADARVSLRYFGETLLAVQTEDGVREPRNRRVVVTVE